MKAFYALTLYMLHATVTQAVYIGPDDRPGRLLVAREARLAPGGPSSPPGASERQPRPGAGNQFVDAPNQFREGPRLGANGPPLNHPQPEFFQGRATAPQGAGEQFHDTQDRWPATPAPPRQQQIDRNRPAVDPEFVDALDYWHGQQGQARGPR